MRNNCRDATCSPCEACDSCWCYCDCVSAVERLSAQYDTIVRRYGKKAVSSPLPGVSLERPRRAYTGGWRVPVVGVDPIIERKAKSAQRRHSPA